MMVYPDTRAAPVAARRRAFIFGFSQQRTGNPRRRPRTAVSVAPPCSLADRISGLTHEARAAAASMPPTYTCQYIFNSRSKQRGDASGQPAGTGSPLSRDIGPGAYDPRPGWGQPYWRPWLNDPLRKGSAFASQTVKSKLPRPLTAHVDCLADFGGNYDKFLHGAAPGSRAQTWSRGERKPPHFHVPFRAYPLDNGEPRGRSPGLDQFYDLDSVRASPIALNGTLAVNMKHTDRKYASIFKSKVPARPSAAAHGGSGELGPGQYNVAKNTIRVKEPARPSSAFIAYSGGKFRNVGGPRGDGGLWPDEEVVVRGGGEAMGGAGAARPTSAGSGAKALVDQMMRHRAP